MNKKYVLQEFMNLDYSDDLLTEEEREGNRNGTHLIVAGKIQCAEAKHGNGRVYPRPILEREIKNYERTHRVLSDAEYAAIERKHGMRQTMGSKMGYGFPPRIDFNTLYGGVILKNEWLPKRLQ